jgi:hypothetical protein
MACRVDAGRELLRDHRLLLADAQFTVGRGIAVPLGNRNRTHASSAPVLRHGFQQRAQPGERLDLEPVRRVLDVLAEPLAGGVDLLGGGDGADR